MSYCLPKKYSQLFRDAIRVEQQPDGSFIKGPIHPDRLRGMSSEERRAAFEKVFGDKDHAREVNTKYETQLLLKDQQAAMRNFIDDMQGLHPQAKRDMIDQVMGLQEVINPGNARGFLEDLMAKKMGAYFTHDEGVEILQMAEKAQKSLEEWQKDPTNDTKRINFGVQKVLLGDRVNQIKGGDMTAWDHFLNVINLPKQLSTTADLSATFVQLGAMFPSKEFFHSFADQLRFFASEDAYTSFRADMITDPDYEAMQKSGLAIHGITNKIRPGEELIQSNLIEQANQWLKDTSGGKIPNAARAVDRAFQGYVQSVRWNVFKRLKATAEMTGENVEPGSPALKYIAENINTFTGYGNIGIHDEYANAVPFLNLFAWTIRKVSSTLTLMSPVPFIKASPTARNFAMKQLAATLGTTAALYGMAGLMGAEVPTDPSDAHFGFFKVGKTWYNLNLGDKPTYARLLYRLAFKKIVNAAGVESHLGQGFPAQTRMDLIERFARGKLGPNASILSDGLYGQDFMGNDMNWDGQTLTREMADRLIPMSISSYIDVVQNDSSNDFNKILSLTSIFGSNMYVDTPRMQAGLSAWGETQKEAADRDGPNTLDRKLLDINQRMKFPPKTINGNKLTDKQYHDYVLSFGQSAKQQLQAAVESGEWDASSKEDKEKGWKQILRIARRGAQAQVMLQSQDNNDGQDNAVFDHTEEKALTEPNKKYGGYSR